MATTAQAGSRRRPLLWIAASVAGLVVLTVLWNGSDIANTSRRMASAEPAQVAPAALGDGGVRQVWAAASGPDATSAVENYTVIVGAGNGVTGRDPVTGEERWHYRRTTAQLCDWTAADGVVVAVFRTAERCTEAVALDAGTGARMWYRNVSFSADVTLSSTNQITLASTPEGLAALGTTSSGDRWNYAPPEGCLIADSAVGDVGAVLILGCGDRSPGLIILDGFDGTQRWTASLQGTDARLLGSSGAVTVLEPGPPSILQVFDREGVRTASVPDVAPPSQAAGSRAQTRLLGEQLLVFTGTTVSVLDNASGVITWSVQAEAMPSLLGSRLVLLEAGAFVERTLVSGEIVRTVLVQGADPPTGGQLDQIGATVVVTGPQQVAVYR